jgi:hypothetical protein
LAPEMQYTGEKPWDPILLDCYPRVGGTNSTTVYEDDTLTTAYQRGKFRKTDIWLTEEETEKIGAVRVKIAAAEGTFRGALTKRAWTLRIHPPANWPKDWMPKGIKINGEASDLPRMLSGLARAENAMPLGDPTGAPDGNVFEINLPAKRVSQSQSVYISFAPPNQ